MPVQDLSAQADGVRVTFDLLGLEAALAGTVLAWVGGVAQTPVENFVLEPSGTQVTFAAPPDAGWGVVVQFSTSASGDSEIPVVASGVDPFE